MQRPHSKNASSQQPYDSFGPFDGRAFCTWWSWVITTPNQDTIPTPNLRDCKVHLRSDLRYGPDDHTLWPQVFVPEYPHLAAIPRKPEDPHHPLSIMWYNPTTFDFVLCPNSLIDGLGQLSPSRFKALDDCRREVDARVRAYVEATEKPDNLVQNLLHVTRHSGVRICSLQTTFLEMLFGVTEFQRYFLELLGRIDFLEIYQPRMEGRAPCATSAADCLGAFTNNPQVAQQLFDAGLPLYLFWPSDRWSANNHVTGSLVKPLRPSDIVFAESETPFPVIFQGSAMDHKKHASMHNYSRTWMIYGDPFANEHNDLDPHTTGEPSKWYASRTIPISDLLQPRLPVTSSSSQSLSASSLRSLSRRSKGSKASGSQPYSQQTRRPGTAAGRNKFRDPDSPYVPPVRRVWADALAAVDTSPGRLVEKTKSLSHFGHYALPDPALFITPADDKKKVSYLLTWLRARPALMYRLQKQESTALSNQAWRDFLEKGRSKMRDDTAAAARRAEIQRVMGGVLQTAGVSEAPPDANLGPVHWRDEELACDKLPRPSVFWDILWELYELNFRFELSSLDRRASNLKDPLDSVIRIERLRRCFPDTSDFPFVTIPTANVGLVANDWKERLPFVLALVNVMAHWEGSQPSAFEIQSRAFEDFTQDQALELEREAALFYTQTFYNYFGRAALIPHCILNPVT